MTQFTVVYMLNFGPPTAGQLPFLGLRVLTARLPMSVLARTLPVSANA
jgi:hypothetical protein